MDDNGGFLSSLLTNTNPLKDPLFFLFTLEINPTIAVQKKKIPHPWQSALFPGWLAKYQ